MAAVRIASNLPRAVMAHQPNGRFLGSLWSPTGAEGVKVERCTCKYAVNEAVLKSRVCLEEGVEVLGVVVVEVGRPCCKNTLGA